MMPMERKQVYLDPGSDKRLKELAKRKGVSEASLIREAVGAYLDKAEKRTGEAVQGDSLLDLIGLYRGDLPPNAAADHDRYLYGGKEE